VAESQRRYYEANKEKVAETQRRYYEANKEKVAETQRRYREANKEKVAAFKREIGIKPATSTCLGCDQSFLSRGPHNRLCKKCLNKSDIYSGY
jgi:hypothetical protein